MQGRLPPAVLLGLLARGSLDAVGIGRVEERRDDHATMGRASVGCPANLDDDKGQSRGAGGLNA